MNTFILHGQKKLGLSLDRMHCNNRVLLLKFQRNKVAFQVDLESGRFLEGNGMVFVFTLCNWTGNGLVKAIRGKSNMYERGIIPGQYKRPYPAVVLFW